MIDEDKIGWWLIKGGKSPLPLWPSLPTTIEVTHKGEPSIIHVRTAQDDFELDQEVQRILSARDAQDAMDEDNYQERGY